MKELKIDTSRLEAMGFKILTAEDEEVLRGRSTMHMIPWPVRDEPEFKPSKVTLEEARKAMRKCK